MTLSRRSMLYGSAAFVAVAPELAFGQEVFRSPNGAGATTDSRPSPPAAGRGIAQDSDWLHYGGGLDSNHYAPLDQISGVNFNNLQVAWRFDTNKLGPRPETNYESTPLVIKGRLYVTAGARRDVICLDAATGELRWMHSEDEGPRGVNAPRALSGRGLSYWTDGARERIIYVTPGYRMLSLDLITGAPDPSFGQNGVVDLKLDDDQELDSVTSDIGLQSTPLIASGVIVIGAAHRDSSVPRAINNAKGYIRGYDAATGKRLWIFHTIPRKGEFGYDTWVEIGQAEKTGNAGSWAEMSADEALGLVYVGVEMPTGDYVGMYRKGAGLFGEAIVALDIKTGVRKWHYQMVHHGLWDRDVPCAAILCDLQVEGRAVKALAQPSKQGYLYVLDRTNGRPVWPIPEVKVEKGDVPGEWYSPTQPIPSKPPAFDRQGTKGDDFLVDFTPAIKARAKEIADHYVRGGVYQAPTMATVDGKWGSLMLPASQGGINWPGGSYDPENKMVYIYSKTTVQTAGIIPNPNLNSDFKLIHGIPRVGGVEENGRPAGAPGPQMGQQTLDGPIRIGDLRVAGLPLVKPPYGRVTALDLKNGTLAWQVAHGETPDNIRNHPLLKGLNIPRTGVAANIGPLVTKTLVIIGDGGTFTDERGNVGSRLRAYDKASGKEMGAVFMEAGQSGTPMTYAVGGWQYIVLAISGATVGGSQLIAFRLSQI